jgi:hypothetical protein
LGHAPGQGENRAHLHRLFRGVSETANAVNEESTDRQSQPQREKPAQPFHHTSPPSIFPAKTAAGPPNKTNLKLGGNGTPQTLLPSVRKYAKPKVLFWNELRIYKQKHARNDIFACFVAL